jgi:hypothetical protein
MADSATIDLVFAARFERIIGVRELVDGRVLVSDRRLRALFIVEANGKAFRQIGRSGDGPGEYRSPSTIFPLGHDSSLVIDDRNRKWYLLDGDQFVPLNAAMNRNYLRAGGEIGGVASNGSVLSVRSLGRARTPAGPLRSLTKGRPEHADSLALIVYGPEGVIDTVSRNKSQFLGVTTKLASINGVSETYVGILNPLQSGDQAAMFPNGTIGVAHFSPYSVDWRTPKGVWIRGSPISEKAIPVSGPIKRAVAENYSRDQNGTAIFGEGDFPPWPSQVPPFTLRAVTSGSDGKLYVRRTVLGKDGNRVVDVFSQAGVRVASVGMPRNSRLVGAGLRGLYAVEENDDGEEILTRYKFTGVTK